MDTIKTWLTLREVVEGFISMSSTIGLRRSAILIALIFLIADCSSAASSLTDENDGHQANTFPVTHVEPILVEGLPPLMCGEELCDRPLGGWTLEVTCRRQKKTAGGLLTVRIWIGMAWMTVCKE